MTFPSAPTARARQRCIRARTHELATRCGQLLKRVSVESIQFGVIAGLDPAIHPLAKRMDPRVKPAGDDGMNPSDRNMRQLDDGEVVGCRSVAAGGDTPALLDLVEEPFDEITRAIRS
jgi:hypothetical protein